MNQQTIHSNRILSTTAALLICAALAACGSGGGDEPAATANPGSTLSLPSLTGSQSSQSAQAKGGAYIGNFGSDEVTGIVSESGDARFYSERSGTMYVLSTQTSGDHFVSSIRVLREGAAASSGTAQGYIGSDKSINGVFDAGGESGSFAIYYDAGAYEQGSSLSRLTGVWNYVGDNGEFLSLSNSADGSYFGQDAEGCAYNGVVRIINGQFNAYSVSLSKTCGVVAETYSGLATLYPAQGFDSERLVYLLSNSNRGDKQIVFRQ